MVSRSLVVFVVLVLSATSASRADNCGKACRDGVLLPYVMPVCQPPWYVANPWTVVTVRCSPNDPCLRPIHRAVDYHRGPVGYAPYPQLCYPRHRSEQQTEAREEVPTPYAP